MIVKPFSCNAQSRFCALAHGADCPGDLAKHEACGNTEEHGPHHIPGNFELWQRKYGKLPQWVPPILIQGDSRRLREVLREAGISISSPPYADGCAHTGGTDPHPEHIQDGPLRYMQYGAEMGVGSPPYAEGLGHPRGNTADAKEWREKSIGSTRYGTGPAQLGNLPAGSVEAAVEVDCGVSSPPYEDSWHDPGKGWLERCESAGVDTNQIKRYGNGKGMNLNAKGYGTSPDQLGNTQGDTFWSAAKQILTELFAILKPNGHAIWVCKNYIRNGKVVPFSEDWAKLCVAVGFEVLHHHKAMLVETHGIQTSLFGTDTTVETRRESFFRRMNRLKGAPAIEWEDIICCRKPEVATPMPPDEAWEQLPLVDCAVTSSPYNLPMSQDHNGSRGGKRGTTPSEKGAFVKYGNTPGQLEGMPTGSVDMTITSSPYAGAGEVLGTHNGIDWTKATSAKMA